MKTIVISSSIEKKKKEMREREKRKREREREGESCDKTHTRWYRHDRRKRSSALGSALTEK